MHFLLNKRRYKKINKKKKNTLNTKSHIIFVFSETFNITILINISVVL